MTVEAAQHRAAARPFRTGFLRAEWSTGTRAKAAAAGLVLAGCAATPFAAVPLAPAPRLTSAFCAAMVVLNLLLAVLLFTRGAARGRRDTIALGAAYLYAALCLAALAMSLPGAIIPDPVTGTGPGAIWMWTCWHGGFGLAILRYAAIAARPQAAASPVARSAVTAAALAGALYASATLLLPYLPPIDQGGATLSGGPIGVVPALLLVLLGLGAFKVERLEARTPEQVWLAVGMVAACLDVWLTYWGVSRYTLGWYLAQGCALFTSVTVLIGTADHRLYSANNGSRRSFGWAGAAGAPEAPASRPEPDCALADLQREVFGAVAAGQAIGALAERLCELAERLAPSVAFALLRLDESGVFRASAGLRLPEPILRALDGLRIGPDGDLLAWAQDAGGALANSSGRAAQEWALPGGQPLAGGFRGCWSTPVRSNDGGICGVLALYFPKPRPPTPREREIAEALVPLCALAIARSRMWDQLQEANERFDVALGNMTQGLCFFSKGRLVVANRRFSEIYGLPPGRIAPGTTLQEIVDLRVAAGSGPKATAAAYLAWRDGVHTSADASDTEVELANGRIIAIHHQPMPDGGWVATHEDVTERRLAEAALRHATQHDMLTGLPNRALFLERVQDALAGHLAGEGCGIVCLGIDQFRNVNDIFGHAVGDGLLRIAAARLQACLDAGEAVGRVGGVDFVLLLLGAGQADSLSERTQRLIAAVSEPYDIDGHSIVIGCTAGIAIPPPACTGAGRLMQSAATALYRAKQEARGSYRLFEPEMDARLQARFMLERDLRTAVRDGEFELVYQPLLNLGDNAVSGFEALLRWRHPSRGLVSPAEFIPPMEETGLIVTLGAWVLLQACLEAARWPAPVKVAVNLSAVQFARPGLVPAVQDALCQSGLDAARLELEITESVLLREGAETLATLHALRGLGVRIAMDDFGTGYSSLSYLRSFPFDKIKIDQSFIRDIPLRSDSLAIIRAVVGLGQGMGMTTTAEGVETQEQMEHLRREGCTEVQGYLISRPVAPEVARAMLEGRHVAQVAAVA